MNRLFPLGILTRIFTFVFLFSLTVQTNFSAPNFEVQEDFSTQIISGLPLEIQLQKYVDLLQVIQSELESGKEIESLKEKEAHRAKQSTALLSYFETAQGYREFMRYLNNAGLVEKQALFGLSQQLNKRLKATFLNDEGDTTLGPRESQELSNFLQEQELRDTYQYAYGKEISRETIDEFEAIHRSTFFENKSHNVNIGIDFLEPIKKILKALKLQDKFSWVFENTLFFGYKSSFIHNKKVFMRFKGYYGKIAVKVELMRRKRYWWGYGSWENAGVTTKLLEEPIAIVGNEVKELD